MTLDNSPQEIENHSQPVTDLYKDWFLDYASYVILDRAIPRAEDGLKPVQRRILHALFELEDGRYNKAANVIGHTMRYHPHGDMAIGEALVKLAQKDIVIDTQGNWGNVLTGDQAAASRYIEARLNPFAKEVLFQEGTTEWQPSYDGRNKEPVILPVKFPLLLALGTEGIAVGLATKVLPHNFCELIKESITILKGYKPELYPDFPSGGIADISEYKAGQKGSKVRVRAVISVRDPKTLCISELPFGVTTTSLIESILAANEKGQIKIKKVEDNTAAFVEILVHLPPGQSPEKSIQALYAFTDCEVSIAPNCCVIIENKPQFCSVLDFLKLSTERTKSLLQRDLEIQRDQIRERLHFAILERVFIEERIYRLLEKCESWEAVLKTLRKALSAHADKFVREPNDEDLNKLTEVRIKRITKYDQSLAEKNLEKLREDLKITEKNLKQIVPYTISYFQSLLKRYGAGKERKTRLESFSKVNVSALVIADQKLYIDRKEGFVGTSLKKDEFLCECSKLDEVIAICQDGTFFVTKVSEKTFVGKNVVWAGLFRRGDERRVYHLLYQEGRGGGILAKRFNLPSAVRDKSHALVSGKKTPKLLYASLNPNGEAEKIKLLLKASESKDKKEMAFEFATLPIKPRNAAGTLVTKQPILKVVQAVKGASTLAARRLSFDRATLRLNEEGQGAYLGKFEGDEKLLAIYQSGTYEIVPAELDQQFADDLIELQKWVPGEAIISTIYYDGAKDDVFVKRVALNEDCNTWGEFIPRGEKTRVLLATLKANPVVKAEFEKGEKGKSPSSPTQMIKLGDFIDLKSLKASGERLSPYKIKDIRMVREETK